MSEVGCEMTVDAAAYVLGALGDDEAERFRAHLSGCAACRQEVAELQPVVDLLPTTVPADRAPSALQDRIMAVVNSEAELLHAAGSGADRPPRRTRRRVRLRPLGALAAATAAAAGLIVGLAVNSGGGSSTAPTRVTAGVVASGTGSRAVLRQSGGHAELDVSNLAQAPRGRVYEVWVQRGRSLPTPTDALFVVNRSGDAAVAVPGDLHGVQRVMVTNEPVGGSLIPTTSPIINIRLA